MLTVKEAAERLDLKLLAGGDGLNREISGGYVGDLLSCVMTKAKARNLWVTVQGHPNIIAVATLTELSGIIVTEGARVETATLDKANQEGIPVFTTSQDAFNVVAALVAFGVQGNQC